MFYWKICENFKDNFFYRTPPVGYLAGALSMHPPDKFQLKIYYYGLSHVYFKKFKVYYA